MSIQTKKNVKKMSTPPPLMPQSALWPIIGGQGGLAKMQGMYNFLQKFTKKRVIFSHFLTKK